LLLELEMFVFSCLTERLSNYSFSFRAFNAASHNRNISFCKIKLMQVLFFNHKIL
ncbi:mCG1030948, partial [Mus musculus]